MSQYRLVFASHFYIRNLTIFLPRRIEQRVLEMPRSPTDLLRWLMCGLQRLPWWGHKPPHWLGDSPKQASCAYLGGGFSHIVLFSPQQLGKFPILTSIFSIWLKPPTSHFLHSPKLAYIARENAWLEDVSFWESLYMDPLRNIQPKNPSQDQLCHRWTTLPPVELRKSIITRWTPPSTVVISIGSIGL